MNNKKIEYESRFDIHYFEKHKQIHSNLVKFLNSNLSISNKVILLSKKKVIIIKTTYYCI